MIKNTLNGSILLLRCLLFSKHFKQSETCTFAIYFITCNFININLLFLKAERKGKTSYMKLAKTVKAKLYFYVQ